MRLSSVKTVMYIAEVNDIEREMLETLGFHKSGEADGCECWEHSMDFSQKNAVTYQEIGTNLILGSDGAVFIKLQNGYYTDKDRNEYQYNNSKLVPVLIQNKGMLSTPKFEITDAEYHDELGKEKAYWDYEVKIADNRYVLIRVYDKGLIYTVQNEEGSKIYDYDGNYFSETFEEEKVFAFVKEHYEKEEKGYE